jgi:hypothetical protein
MNEQLVLSIGQLTLSDLSSNVPFLQVLLQFVGGYLNFASCCLALYLAGMYMY